MNNFDSNIILYILSFSDNKDFLYVSLGNKRLYHICKKERMKRMICFYTHKVYQEGIRDGFLLEKKSFPSLTGFYMYENPSPTDFLFDSTMNIRRLQKELVHHIQNSKYRNYK